MELFEIRMDPEDRGDDELLDAEEPTAEISAGLNERNSEANSWRWGFGKKQRPAFVCVCTTVVILSTNGFSSNSSEATSTNLVNNLPRHKATIQPSPPPSMKPSATSLTSPPTNKPPPYLSVEMVFTPTIDSEQKVKLRPPSVPHPTPFQS